MASEGRVCALSAHPPVDRVEHLFKPEAERLERDHGGERYERCDQAVFDGGRAFFVVDKMVKQCVTLRTGPRRAPVSAGQSDRSQCINRAIETTVNAAVIVFLIMSASLHLAFSAALVIG